MATKTPVHPGATVREDCLRPLRLSVTEGARRLGIGRQTLSNLVNEKASVASEMAHRLSKALGSTPETSLGMQLAFNLRGLVIWKAQSTSNESLPRRFFPSPPRHPN